MKLISTLITITLLAFFTSASAQNTGVGEKKPGSTFSVKGGVSVGDNYARLKSPKAGMIVEGAMGVGTATPDANAILDLQSSNKGILLPRMTSAERKAIEAPASGLLVFDTDLSAFVYYNGKLGRWNQLGGANLD